MKYIRTREDALDAAAEILDLPDRADRLVQSTVRIMMCLDVEPRDFLCDCQALLIQGGLEALARRRREALEAADELLVVLDPEEDRLLEAVGRALDALRFADILRQVFPDLRHERWQAGRAVLRREAEMRDLAAAAIRARGDREALDRARRGVEAALAEARPAWIDRAGALLSACRDALRSTGTEDPDALRDEGTLLFELAAMDDARAEAILGAAPDSARAQVLRLRELAEAVRALALEEPGREEGATGSRSVA